MAREINERSALIRPAFLNKGAVTFSALDDSNRSSGPSIRRCSNAHETLSFHPDKEREKQIESRKKNETTYHKPDPVVLSMLRCCIDTPLLLLFSIIGDMLSVGFSTAMAELRSIEMLLLRTALSVDVGLALFALSYFPVASLSDESDDCRFIIRLDNLLSISDVTTCPNIDNPPTGSYDLFDSYSNLSIF